METLLLRPKEVGELISFGKTMVYKLINSKELPSCRIGKSIRVPVSALKKWAEEKGIECTPPIQRQKETATQNHQTRKGAKK